MKEKFKIPLDEKFRIQTHISHNILESEIFSEIDLTYNQFIILKILFATVTRPVFEFADSLKISRPTASKNIDILV
jgi:DNA-binding MarR family transcriptional regulator